MRAGAVRGIFQSMVELSDSGDLMTRFLGLPCPTMFMYGEQNASLSYLEHIARYGVRLAEIPSAAIFRCTPTRWRCGGRSRISMPTRRQTDRRRYSDRLTQVRQQIGGFGLQGRA